MGPLAIWSGPVSNDWVDSGSWVGVGLAVSCAVGESPAAGVDVDWVDSVSGVGLGVVVGSPAQDARATTVAMMSSGPANLFLWFIPGDWSLRK